MYVLLHSPSVGPRTMDPLAAALISRGERATIPDLRSVAGAKPPFWPVIVQLATEGIPDVPADEPLILCAHSNAGFFLPIITVELRRPVAGLVFMDAGLPPDDGEVAVVPPHFLTELRQWAVEGWLPRWTDWWSEEDIAPLFPDVMTRQRVAEEQMRLPLAYYEQRVPVPGGWTRIPAGYVVFGPPYEELADRARARGWPIDKVAGKHLHMLVDPEAVADALMKIVDGLLVTGSH